MFGTVSLEMCSTCLADEFAVLAKPLITKDEPDWYFRECVVPTKCSRCSTSWERTLTRFPFGSMSCLRTVCLSARVLADTASLYGKCQASMTWGTKPANAELQLNNLLAAEQDALRERALLTVGAWAIKDEIAFSRDGCPCGGVLLNGFQATAWKRFVVGVDDQPHGGAANEPPPPGTTLETGDGPSPSEGATQDSESPTCPAPRPAPGLALQQALTSERVDEQQRAFVEGAALVGETVTEHTATAKTKGQAEDDEEPIGTRKAHGRFPQVGDKPVYLFNNDPRCLEASQALRDRGVGTHDPSLREHESMKAALREIKAQIFTESAMRKSLGRYEDVRKTAMPAKLSPEQKMEWQLEALNTADGDRLSYSKTVSAFVKAEVSAKPKPRPIANHKEVRLTALAKIAWVFEDVMFHALEMMSIKHRTKSKVLSDIAKNLSGMRSGKWCENDLTAFEFGISETLKEAECDVLRHIASFVGLEETGSLLFERVVGDRCKPVVWSMMFIDSAGERKVFKLTLPRAMRESGDRLTSSGNFFQNLLAWLSFLVPPEHMAAAVASLKKTKGANLFYISARDGKKYLARLIFEGDDTLGRLEEAVWEPVCEGGQSFIDDFLRRWGWKPKLLWKSETGYDYARVVGYDILLHDNAAVHDGDSVVACPEMKRLINTKEWTCSSVTAEQRKTCTRIFAATLGKEFAKCEPMWAFCKGVYDANAGGAAVTDEMVREQYLRLHGVLPEYGSSTLSSIPYPDFEGADDRDWKALARVSCGDFTDIEWATATAVPDMMVHGADLAVHLPRSWVA